MVFVGPVVLSVGWRGEGNGVVVVSVGGGEGLSRLVLLCGVAGLVLVFCWRCWSGPVAFSALLGRSSLSGVRWRNGFVVRLALVEHHC